MTDTLTPAKSLVQQTVGGNNNSWGTILNNSLGLIDSALGGTLVLSISGNITLNSTQAQNTGYKFTGTLTGNATVTWPSFFGMAAIRNTTSGGFSIICGIGGATVTVLSGETVAIWSDGADFIRLAQVGGGAGSTGTGSVVLATSPTISGTLALTKNNADKALSLITPDDTSVTWDSQPLAALFVSQPPTATTRNFLAGIWVETNGSTIDKGRGIGIHNFGASDGLYIQTDGASATGFASYLTPSSTNATGGVISTTLASHTGLVIRQETNIVANADGVLLHLQADGALTEMVQVGSSLASQVGFVFRMFGANSKPIVIEDSGGNTLSQINNTGGFFGKNLTLTGTSNLLALTGNTNVMEMVTLTSSVASQVGIIACLTGSGSKPFAALDGSNNTIFQVNGAGGIFGTSLTLTNSANSVSGVLATITGTGSNPFVARDGSSNTIFQVNGVGGIFGTSLTLSSTSLVTTTVSLSDGAGVQSGTLTNAPIAGNPTKWISINDNGTTRKIPAW